jgi:hypothetical protein
MSFGRSDTIGHEIRRGNHTTKLSWGDIRICCPKPSECPKTWGAKPWAGRNDQTRPGCAGPHLILKGSP